jgi:hypothetical protein
MGPAACCGRPGWTVFSVLGNFGLATDKGRNTRQMNFTEQLAPSTLAQSLPWNVKQWSVAL